MSLPNRLRTPSFLQRLQWVTDPVGYIQQAAQQYPDIFTAKVIGFGNTVIFVNHPQGIKEILTNDRNKFAALGELNKILQPLTGDYSIFMLDGDRHKQQRQILMPPFHAERMQSYGELIYNLTTKIFSQLPLEKPFSAHIVMQEISLQVILQVIFGLYEGETCQQLKHLFLVLMSHVFRSPLRSSLLLLSFLQQDLGAWSPWGKFLRDRHKIDELLYTEITQRREKPNLDRIDILSLLMSARDEAGNPMTDKELRDQLITLMLAGYETTATSMAWAFYWIHKKPQVHEKIHQELDALGDFPDPMTIVRLPYLTAICNETLRIHPVSMFTLPRIVKEPTKLLGYSLEPGAIVQGCIYITHHREDLYPEPKEFKPERFLERQFSPYEFLPFGGGVRRCIGEALAMFEMKLVLTTILSRYQFVLADKRPEKPQRRGLTLGPANGVNVVITRRRAGR
jgi:unspecific monooxygenase